MLLLALRLQYLLQLGRELVLLCLLRQLGKKELHGREEVLVDTAKQRFDLIKLGAGRPEDFRGAREVIHYSYRQNLLTHHLLYFFPSLLVAVRLLELGNRVFVFVSIFPPVGTQLADVAHRVLFQAVGKLR